MYSGILTCGKGSSQLPVIQVQEQIYLFLCFFFP